MKNLEIILYTTLQGRVKVEALVWEETVWLIQKMLPEFFGTIPQNITLRLKNIYEEGELCEAATCKDFLQVQIEGNREVKRSQKFYNLDAIISLVTMLNQVLPHSFVSGTQKNISPKVLPWMMNA